MCYFFSYIIDSQGRYYYSNAETRAIKLREPHGDVDAHSFIAEEYSLNQDDIFKYELYMEPKRWKRALESFKETGEVPYFIFKYIKYEGGLPEQEQSSLIDASEKEMFRNLFKSGEMLKILKIQWPNYFIDTHKISEIHHKAIKLSGYDVKRIMNSYPLYVNKGCKKRVLNLHNEGKYICVFYLKNFYHPEGEYRSELRIGAYPLIETERSFNVIWDVENLWKRNIT